MQPAREALDRALRAARATGIPILTAEVARASRALNAPVARLIVRSSERPLRLDKVEMLLASNALVMDACRYVARAGTAVVPLASRPVLFALAEAWPDDVSRETLLARGFRAWHADGEA